MVVCDSQDGVLQCVAAWWSALQRVRVSVVMRKIFIESQSVHRHTHIHTSLRAHAHTRCV